MSGERAPARRAGGFTEQVRQELAKEVPSAPCCRRALRAGLLGLGATIHLRGGDDGPALRLELVTSSGAVARAAYSLMRDPLPSGRPELAVRGPGGLNASPSYAVAVEDGAVGVAMDVGLLDHRARPTRLVPSGVLDHLHDRLAYATGVVLAAGSFSAPGREPHLEVVTPNGALAGAAADALSEAASHPAGVSRAGDRWRAVLKSRSAIGQLLGSLGATSAYLAWEEQRVRREVRGAATRLANADAANLRRAVEAATEQIRTVQRAIERVGWDGLRDDLRSVALARLANPEASLSELGALCEPPVGKSAVHRRLARLEALAEAESD